MLAWLKKNILGIPSEDAKYKQMYLDLLQKEVARLRDENRQLVNSILASHNMPQIDAPRADKELVPLKRPNWLDYRRKKEAEAAKPSVPVVPAPEGTKNA